MFVTYDISSLLQVYLKSAFADVDHLVSICLHWLCIGGSYAADVDTRLVSLGISPKYSFTDP